MASLSNIVMWLFQYVLLFTYDTYTFTTIKLIFGFETISIKEISCVRPTLPTFFYVYDHEYAFIPPEFNFSLSVIAF